MVTIRGSLALVAALVLAPGVFALDGTDQTSYGFFNIVEGGAELGQDGLWLPASDNHPLLTGDEIATESGARVEILLPDRNRLRLAGDTAIRLRALAGSRDLETPGTVLELHRGEAQITTLEESLGVDPVRFDLPGATAWLQRSGRYGLGAWAEGTSILVHAGSARVQTRDDEQVIAAPAEVWVEADGQLRIRDRIVSDVSDLEAWADTLDREADAARYYADENGIDQTLAYQSTGLAQHGSWSSVGGQSVWRPSVGGSWRPYANGSWVTTPSGLAWSSSEPWGSLTYHYGSWNRYPGFGWGWSPGRYYMPAWVYWYWGPQFAGWCPYGYYQSFYSGYGSSWLFPPRYSWSVGPEDRGRYPAGPDRDFGVHGTAGGTVASFGDWTFVPSRELGAPEIADVARTAHQLAGIDGIDSLDRGVITTDTSPISPDLLRTPAAIPAELLRRPELSVGPTGVPADLDDFVARRPTADPEAVRIALGLADPDDRSVPPLVAATTSDGGAGAPSADAGAASPAAVGTFLATRPNGTTVGVAPAAPAPTGWRPGLDSADQSPTRVVERPAPPSVGLADRPPVARRPAVPTPDLGTPTATAAREVDALGSPSATLVYRGRTSGASSAPSRPSVRLRTPAPSARPSVTSRRPVETGRSSRSWTSGSRGTSGRTITTRPTTRAPSSATTGRSAPTRRISGGSTSRSGSATRSVGSSRGRSGGSSMRSTSRGSSSRGSMSRGSSSRGSSRSSGSGSGGGRKGGGGGGFF